MVEVSDVLRAERGSIVAPAGCGKTELIANVVARASGRVLVLTHTNAGVKALRERTRRMGISREQVSIETITGWSLRFASAYPQSSGLQKPTPEGADWNDVCEAAVRLLGVAAIRAVVSASFTRLLVDEYQDCSSLHHRLIGGLATLLPCCVLGDPLQGIFDFENERLDWGETVSSIFPSLGELTEPWRWRGKNEALGAWLLQIRQHLMNGDEIDLESAPVSWLPIHSSVDDVLRSLRFDGDVVAVRRRAEDAHAFAASTDGAFASMEEVECKDLLAFARSLDGAQSEKERRLRIATFASTCLTNMSAEIVAIRERAKAGLNLEPRQLALMTPLNRAGSAGDPLLILDALEAFRQFTGAKLYRPELWEEARRFLKFKAETPTTTFFEAAWNSRNRRRASSSKTRLTASRTLLIKGLEYDHAVILAATEYENGRKPGEGAKHFYVAATRGSRSLTILSPSRKLRFSPAQR